MSSRALASFGAVVEVIADGQALEKKQWWATQWRRLAFRLSAVIDCEEEDRARLESELAKVSATLAETGGQLDALKRRVRGTQAFLSQYEGAAKEGARMLGEALDAR